MISWEKMLGALTRIQSSHQRKRACVGFDGYVDTLYRVVRSRKSLQDYELFSTIAEFADRVGRAAGRSADMELQTVSRRMGGNAPLMAEAMACLDVSARCIGTMGVPELDDVFAADRVHFLPSSVAPSAESLIFEFQDGKLMFGSSESLLTLDWSGVVNAVGLETLRQWYKSCDLWAVVNWSFVMHCNNILEGLRDDVIEADDGDGKLLFFDLADPGGRSRTELEQLFGLLKQLNGRTRVVLSMNENESIHVASALELRGEPLSPACRAGAIREALGIYMASIHGLDYAVAATAEQTSTEESIFNPMPAISTGGGDHFNGGFATALIHGLSPDEAIAFGNLVSSCYVTRGKSPSLTELSDYLAEQRNP